MNPEINKEQKEQLSNWAYQRDLLLSEISSLRDTEQKLNKRNKELSFSNSEIADKMNKIKGNIEELQKKESELPQLIRKDISSLQSQKTILETEIFNLNKIILILLSQKKVLENDITFLTNTFNSLHDRVGILDKVVGHVTEISSKNDKSITKLSNEIKDVMYNIIEDGKRAAKELETVSAELPKVFLEVQRKSLERQIINKKKI